jgi:excisionase family DNA binding protein
MNTREPRGGPGELLTIAEVAHALRVSPQTVRRRCEDGQLEFLRIGSGSRPLVRIPESAVRSLLRPGAKP